MKDDKEKLLGSIKLHPGQKLWEYNMETGIIKRAQYKEIEHHMIDGKDYTEKKLIVKPGHLYAAAINARNADKKFVEKVTGMKYRQFLRSKGFDTK